MQKEEMANGREEINDEFLMELRLNDEFNRILARGCYLSVF
jgi:hypothetical protein